ncbi:PIG-L deacetylase family protein [Streptomyces sp. NPDC048248]|uniref:PIG-L deacetylase family protein n=1 Tax=Streptomyces sp. NPDC048248 TaxID=3365523 RepID=UPI00371D64EF
MISSMNEGKLCSQSKGIDSPPVREGAQLVLSPHFDDAALSVTLQAIRPGSTVVTVFSGAPSENQEETVWDALTRAQSAVSRHWERVAEDSEAMSGIGCSVRHLGEPEEQYRSTSEVDIGRLEGLISPWVSNASEVWAPAAIGGHADHIAVRKAALAACRAVGDLAPELYFYADLPYSLAYGWPSWVTGKPFPEYLDTDFWLNSELAAQGIDDICVTRKVFPLDRGSQERKRSAVRSYKSQLPALGLGPTDVERWDQVLGYEVAWRVLL